MARDDSLKIGNSTARALASAGHTVYASMRDPAGRGTVHAQGLLDLGRDEHLDLRVIELDVQSQDSADAAARTVIDEAGYLDVVVHNAGHLVLGYAEAFTAEEIAHVFDINVLGQQRVNRAVLPHMRERGTGYLVYVGSTTVPIYPPFCAPYVASKTAGDALAVTTSYEVSQLGIETTVVQPGGPTSAPSTSRTPTPLRTRRRVTPTPSWTRWPRPRPRPRMR